MSKEECNKYNVILGFSYLESGILKLSSNAEWIINEILDYYSYNIVKFPSEKIVDQIDIIQIGENDFQVTASYYLNNPKTYYNCSGLKLVTDIVEDYLENKIKYQNLSGVILHASALMYRGFPIIFIGASKSGKSTAVLNYCTIYMGRIFCPMIFCFLVMIMD